MLALSSAFIGINIYKALENQRFKNEADAVLDTLRLAQNLMLIMDADVHVHFKTAEDKQSIEMQLSVDNALPNKKFLNLISKKILLKHILFVDFRDENKTHGDSDRIDVKFLSKGSYMSKGLMRLATYKINDSSTSDKKTGLKRYISLAGYPKPLHLSHTKENLLKDEKQELELNQRIISMTLSEIESKSEKESS